MSRLLKKKGVASVRANPTTVETSYIVSIKDHEGEFSLFLAAWNDKRVALHKSNISLTDNIRKALRFDYHQADAVAIQVSAVGYVARVERVSDDFMQRTVS